MDNTWRTWTRSVTKYNPVFRDASGNYFKDEWTGFGQIGQVFNGEVFLLESYFEAEKKYIQAAIVFFQFHRCDRIKIQNIEKMDWSEYRYQDRDELIGILQGIKENAIVTIDSLIFIVKLVLRDLLWCELFCSENTSVVLRFGYDFYMYVNSDRDLKDYFQLVTEIGLFID